MLQLIDTDTDFDGFVTEHYTTDTLVTLAGDSIWDCTLTEVRVTDICVTSDEESGFRTVNVYYTQPDGSDAEEGSWTMYTDTGFPQAISKLLGYEVNFKEQGMQEDGVASME